jgi:CRISPR-associated protein Csb2
MLAIAWQYLSGRAVATDPTDRQAAEWPPHPDRVFQALVAAWGERGCSPAERDALEWLETLGPPLLAAPDESLGAVSRTTVTTAYVPVNDTASPLKGSGKKLKTSQPIQDTAIGRDRQPRCFPSLHVGDTTCALVWPEAQASHQVRADLATLCAAVTHIGHPSSMARLWLADAPPPPAWVPVTGRQRAALSFRVPHAGRLSALVKAYAGGGDGWQRPPTAPWQGYARVLADSATPHSPLDSRLIILRKTSADRCPGLIQAPAFVAALRGTLLAKASERAKPWISGHLPDGAPLEQAHVAWLPLAYVGSEHADGHLLGFGIALPRDLSPDDEQAVLDALADAVNPDTGELRLVAGTAGAMDLAEEDRPAPPFALRAETWTRAADCWGSVTPVALDRLPPRRHENNDAWVADQIAAACSRQGLPAPCEVRILPVSPHLGAPAARAFPPLVRKPDGARRWHVHVALRFPQPVAGPLLLGAGRYQGYGFCRPLAIGLVGSAAADSLPLAHAATLPSASASASARSEREGHLP